MPNRLSQVAPRGRSKPPGRCRYPVGRNVDLLLLLRLSARTSRAGSAGGVRLRNLLLTALTRLIHGHDE